jgi:hypothetical protein
MIRMPHRNVTRFFIPLIDVLILLFCIFLLMEFNTASEVDALDEVVADKSEEMQIVESDRHRLLEELQKFEALRPKLEEMEKLIEENKALKAANQKTMQESVYIRIIDVSPKDGSISFYDETRKDTPVIQIDDAKRAQVLIERHRKEAGARNLYYYFMYPRIGSLQERFPTTFGQEQDYRTWFKSVPNSLKKVGI